MTFDNDKYATRFKIFRFAVTIFFLAIIAFTAMSFYPEEILFYVNIPFLNIVKFGVHKSHLILAYLFPFAIIVVITHMLDYYYIYFSDNGNKITFRYYSLNLLKSAKNAMEVDKSRLADVKVHKAFFGKKIFLTLYVRQESKIVKYPSININAMFPKEREALLNVLRSIMIRATQGMQ